MHKKSHFRSQKKLSVSASVVCIFAATLYPLFLAANTINESSKIVASDGEGIDLFGSSIAIEGDTLMVGVSRDDDGPAGGGPNDSGSVYVYTRDANGNWGNETRLTASDAGLGDWFGWSVDMEGTVAVVGAVQANPVSGEGIITGAAYAFEKGASGWNETNILAGSGQQLQYQFGDAVATDGNTIAVGNWRDRDIAANSGAVHLFERDATGLWGEILKLKSPGPLANEHFGDNIAMDNGVLVVSNWRERRVEDVNGFGAAYVYKRTQTGGWQLQQRLIPDDIADGDDFSFDVDIDGNVIVIGAPGDADLGINAGAAYVFEQNTNNTWEQVSKLYGSDTVANAKIGKVVSIDDGGLVIGSEEQDEFGLSTGAAYLFYENSSGNWVEQAKLLASDASSQDQFAHALAMDSQTIAIGAWRARVNHDLQGAAYLYEIDLPDPMFCNGRLVDVFIGNGDMPTSGDDVILGTNDNDNITAMGGDDTICGLGGNDDINGGRGEDWIDAGAGNDTVNGANDDDEIFGDTGIDTLFGGPGNDTIYGEDGDDFIKGNSGNDTLHGDAGIDKISGGSGNDTIYTGTGSNVGTLQTVTGGNGNDAMFGGSDADEIRGEAGNDTITGGVGNDRLFGGAGEDDINGQAGNDLVRGNAADDVLRGGAGNDQLDGLGGNDEMYGGAGEDSLNGSTGNDTMFGESGDDFLNGGGGNDALNGGGGTDDCNGAGGNGDSAAACEVESNIP